LPTFSKTLYNNVVTFPASNSEPITSGTRRLQTNCYNVYVQFVITATRKTSFSFTTMPGLTPVCAHVRQSQNWDGLFFPVLLTAQIWHPLTDYRLFGPAKDELRGSQFADDNELKQKFS
jgi:hypothetical protein